jgi:hypothetical protein
VQRPRSGCGRPLPLRPACRFVACNSSVADQPCRDTLPRRPAGARAETRAPARPGSCLRDCVPADPRPGRLDPLPAREAAGKRPDRPRARRAAIECARRRSLARPREGTRVSRLARWSRGSGGQTHVWGGLGLQAVDGRQPVTVRVLERVGREVNWASSGWRDASAGLAGWMSAERSRPRAVWLATSCPTPSSPGIPIQAFMRSELRAWSSCRMLVS